MECSFIPFRSFIRDMQMGKINFKGKRWTCTNNRQGEGFIQKRLDRFFCSPEWLLEFENTKVLHVMCQASDHDMILLDAIPQSQKGKQGYF